MALKLTLKPHEKIAINGAVITNGASKATLSIENSAVILRQKDIMQQEEALTPAKRLYFCIQMAYLDPAASAEYLARVKELARDFVGAAPTAEVVAILSSLGTELAQRNYFQALKKCKTLVTYEGKRLSDGPTSIR